MDILGFSIVPLCPALAALQAGDVSRLGIILRIRDEARRAVAKMRMSCRPGRQSRGASFRFLVISDAAALRGSSQQQTIIADDSKLFLMKDAR
jgi:hypothetical protein